MRHDPSPLVRFVVDENCRVRIAQPPTTVKKVF
jgi:hypothetical protein